MDTDEKNKFSSNINEFDPDFTREKDRYDVAKEDRMFQRHAGVPLDLRPENKGKPHHEQTDPFNVPLKDIDRKNRNLNENYDMDSRDINREESPNNKQLHLHNEREIKQTKKNPHELGHTANKSLEAELGAYSGNMFPQNRTERISEKRDEFPGILDPHGNKGQLNKHQTHKKH
jgi:hypothetical protein